MPTTLKGSQLDTGIKAGQIPLISSAYKFTGTLAAGASVTLTLPAGVDPTLLFVDVCILDTFSETTDPTYNMWIPADVFVTAAKSSTAVKLVNVSANSVQYAAVVR